MSSKRFSGKVALITGSTSGIGYGIAKIMGLQGCTIIVTSRKENNVNNAVQSLNKLGIKCCGKTCHAGLSNKFHKKKYKQGFVIFESLETWN